MPLHVIELHLDATFSQKIRDFWHDIASPLATMQGAPHITLAALPDSQPERLHDIVPTLAQEQRSFTLSFDTVATFAGDQGVVMLPPAPSLALLQLQQHCVRLLQAKHLPIQPFYQADSWMPHVTLSQGESSSRIADILEQCQQQDIFSRATVEEIALVRYQPATIVQRLPLAATQDA